MNKQPTSLDQRSHIAVIGGGVSACFFAHLVAEQSGAKVSIFEKSRGLGGRCSVRYTENGSTFNHGAQFFTIKNADFMPYIHPLLADGHVEVLSGKTAFYRKPEPMLNAHEVDRFHGLPQMNSFLKIWAKKAHVYKQFRVSKISRNNSSWALYDEHEKRCPQVFSHCILTTPIPQGGNIWAAHSPIKLPDITSSPCWALMFTMERLNQDWERCFIRNHVISWVARQPNSKNNTFENWVAHAQGDWSQQNLEMDEATAVKYLVEQLEDFWGRSLKIEKIAAHRWRYASIAKGSSQETFLYDSQNNLGYMGDWFCKGRIEGAMQSAYDLGQMILTQR